MNKHIENFLKDIQKQQEKPARQLVAERAKRLSAIEMRQEPYTQALAKAQQELATAQAQLENLPIDAEPGDIALWKTIVANWPARIGEHTHTVNEFTEEKRAATQECNYGMNRLQSVVTNEIQQAIKDLQSARPDVWRLVD